MADNYRRLNTKELQDAVEEKQTGVTIDNQPVESPVAQKPSRAEKYGFGSPEDLRSYFEYRKQNPFVSNSQEYTEAAAAQGFGRSRYDTIYTPGMDIENARAVEQSNFAKIGSGLIKGGITAVSTGLETTIGTIWGLGSTIFSLGKQALDSSPGISLKKAANSFVNNKVSSTLVKLQQLSDEWFPNYRTAEERTEQYQKEWWKHMGTANFIGDSFLKNFGFTVGAMAGGAAWTSVINKRLRKKLANDLIKSSLVAAEGDAGVKGILDELVGAVRSGQIEMIDASKLATSIENAAKAVNKADAILQLSGAAIGALGEGTMEGLMAKSEFLDEFRQKFDAQYQMEYNNLEQDILDEGNDIFVKKNATYINPDGSTTTAPALTAAGYRELARRQKELAGNRAKAFEYAEQQGENLASMTFLLNLPILTTSNLIQFGRMFSGGWTTARKNASKAISGGLKSKLVKTAEGYARPEIEAAYKALGNKVIKGAFNAIKVAGSEASEEMLQGTASSGTKAVAQARLTDFIDMGYDADAIAEVRDWFGSNFFQGAGDYLSDVKNWQEGALGALTGLFGIPGRVWKGEWNGGLYQAIKDANQEVNAAKEAAANLNDLVNGKDFQDRWHGYIRHLAYDAKMQKATEDNDQYAWHDSNDSQLIGDVMMFAKAGRLNDLMDIVDSYASLTKADAESLKKVIGNDSSYAPAEGDDDIRNMNPEDIVSRVTEQAKDIKDTITQYGKVRDALLARLPADTPENVVDELVFTTLGIKKYEKRFFDMLNETLGVIDENLRFKSQFRTLRDGRHAELITSKKESAERLKELQAYYAGAYSSLVIPIHLSAEDQKRVDDDLYKLEDEVDDEATKKKLRDMRRLMQARRDYYHKLVYLQTPKGMQEHEDTSMSQEKLNDAADNEMSNIETEGLTDFAEISRAYYEKKTIPEKNQFMKDLRKIRKTNSAADEFIKLRDAENGFRAYIKNKGYAPDKSGMTTSMGGNAGMYLDQMINTAARNAQSAEEFLSMSDDILPTREEFGVFNNAGADEASRTSLFNRVVFGGNENIGALYDSFKQIIKDTAKAYSDVKAENTPLEGLSSSTQAAPKSQQAKQTGTDAPQPSSVVQSDFDGAVFGPNPTVTAAKKQPEGAPTEVNMESGIPGSERTESSEVADRPSKEEIAAEQEAAVSDLYSKEFDESEPGENTNIGNAMPEIDSFEAKDVRDKKKSKDEADLSDFAGPAASSARFEKKEDGTLKTLPGNKQMHEGYDESWVAFKDAGGFDAIVSQVKKGDKIEFGIDPSFPKDHEGRNQILMYITRNGERQVVGILGYNTSRTTYYNLRELRKAITDEYDKMADKSQLFIFSKTSEVWEKRPGQFVYGKEKTLAQAGYQKGKSDGAIIFVDRGGNIRFVQGDKSALSKMHLGKFNPNDHRGHLYYLAPTGASDYNNNPEYVPTRLDVEHFNNDTKTGVKPKFVRIRDILASMVKVAMEYSKPNIDKVDVQKRFYKLFTDLSKVLDVHKIDMNVGEFPNTEVVGPALHIVDFNNTKEGSTKKEHTFRTLDQLNVNWLINQIAERDMALQVKQGADGSVTTDVDELIQEGHITTNLELVRAKGANFYILPWLEVKQGSNEWGFAPATESQYRSLERLAELEDSEYEGVSTEEDEYSHMSFDDDAPIQEDVETYTPEDTPEEVVDDADNKLPGYEKLSDEDKAALEENGISEEIYRNPTPDMMELIKQILGCK